MNPDLVIVAADEGFALATWRNVLVSAWREQPVPGRVTATTRAMRDLALAHPSGIGYFMVIEAHTPPPVGRARDGFLDVLRERSMRVASVVAEGEGFQPSIVRGVVTGLVMVVRPAFPIKIVDDLVEGARWLVSHVPEARTADEAAAAAEAVRRCIRRPPGAGGQPRNRR